MKLKWLFLTIIFSIPLFAEYKNIKSSDIQDIIKNDAIIIDVRTKEEWYDTGVIPNSKLLTSHDYMGRFDAKLFVDELAKLNINKNTPLIIVCRSGNRSLDVAKKLDEFGYKELYNLQYGIKEWLRNKYPTTKVTY